MPGPWRHENAVLYMHSVQNVSISTEMPGPWRPGPSPMHRQICWCFNLNRDARPLATEKKIVQHWETHKFQSQPRCQAPGDEEKNKSEREKLIVSISTEMPGPWRRSHANKIPKKNPTI